MEALKEIDKAKEIELLARNPKVPPLSLQICRKLISHFIIRTFLPNSGRRSTRLFLKFKRMWLLIFS